MATGAVPAAIYGESAQAPKGSPARPPKLTQDDSPSLHGSMLRLAHRGSSRAEDSPPSARRGLLPASRAEPDLRGSDPEHQATQPPQRPRRRSLGRDCELARS